MANKVDLLSLEEEANSGSQKLERSLGAFSLVLLGIGAIIGAGLFSITGIAAAQNAGPAIVISFILASIGCAFAGLCFSELASMIPVSGGAYTYTYATLGEFIAWIIGWALILNMQRGPRSSPSAGLPMLSPSCMYFILICRLLLSHRLGSRPTC